MSALIEIRKKFLEDKRPSGNKTLYAMCGIPGAGKSTYVKQQLQHGLFPEGAFLLSPDKVMASLPQYQEACKSDCPEKAFAVWEMPARNLAYRMLGEAKERELDIIIDMGCVREEDFQNILGLKKDGYHIHMFYIFCPPEIAIKRVQDRDRHTPPSMISERYQSLQEYLPKYRALASEFSVYDNSDLDVPFTHVREQVSKVL